MRGSFPPYNGLHSNTFDQAMQDGSWTIYDEIEDLFVPDDLAAALAQDATSTINLCLQRFVEEGLPGVYQKR